VQFLVDAAAQAGGRTLHVPAAVRPQPQASGNFYERTLWVIDLFDRVAERNRLPTFSRPQSTGSSPSLTGAE
jgi:hypothetical protein